MPIAARSVAVSAKALIANTKIPALRNHESQALLHGRDAGQRTIGIDVADDPACRRQQTHRIAGAAHHEHHLPDDVGANRWMHRRAAAGTTCRSPAGIHLPASAGMSRTTPITFRGRSSGEFRIVNVWPSGSESGQNRRAALSLTMATHSPAAVSCSVKSRPRSCGDRIDREEVRRHQEVRRGQRAAFVEV